MSPRPCAACSCALLTPAEKFAKADVIFQGWAIAIAVEPTRSQRQASVTFRADTSWKGVVAREMTVNLDRSWLACGEYFLRDAEYVVYTNGNSPDALTAHPCTGTRSLRDVSQDSYVRADLAFLGTGTPVAARTSPSSIGVGMVVAALATTLP